MPAKKLNGNGKSNGHCKIHSHAATACRACLLHGLQEFRLTNLRAGLRIAAKAISALRAEYAARGDQEVKSVLVAYDLGVLLARLQVADDQAWNLPGDASVMLRAMTHTDGRQLTGRAS